jgi:hypothetical protein
MANASDAANTTIASSTDTRGSPRLFWVGMAVFLIVMVFLGFGSTYGRQLVLGLEISGAGVVETDWVIHLHAAVFVGWMALLLGQAVLAARGRIQAHMTLGKYGGPALGTAVVLAGSLILYQQITAVVANDLLSWAEWPKILLGTFQSWFGLLGFAVLMGLGLRNRRRPAAHKRYMTLATIMLVPAAINRMDYLANTIGIAVMVAPLLAYDLYTERRVRPATLIGTGWIGALLIVEYL